MASSWTNTQQRSAPELRQVLVVMAWTGGKGTVEARSPSGPPQAGMVLLEPGADFAGAYHGG